MWTKIKAWFLHSETILIARLHVLVGALIAVLIPLYGNPEINAAIQSVLGPYGPYWLIGMGLLIEVCRRRGATDLK